MTTAIHDPVSRKALLALTATLASLLMVLTTVALPAQAQSVPPGTTITVDTETDEDNTDGDCSLREAIKAANNNLAAGACPAGSSGGEDTIGFDLAPSTTITVGSPLPAIRGAAGLVIDGGQAADLTVSGGGTSGVFEIGSDAKVAMEGITVSDGFVPRSGGGAIDNLGTLALTNVRVTGSSTDAGGGGIFSNNALTLTDSTVSDNHADFAGGGIYNTGDLTLVSSTISGNTSTQHGGGIYTINDPPNPAENDPGHTTRIENSTIAGNTASGGIGGGILGGGGPIVIKNSTVTDNTDSASSGQCSNTGLCGAVVSVSSMEVRSTIIAGNDGTDVNNQGGITSGGYNFIGLVTKATTATGGFDATADQVGVSDPKLGPLADNGGPTLTNMPLMGSPAVDQGNSFGATADQRGQKRPYDLPTVANAQSGDGSDVGAVELEELPPVNISVSGTTVTEGNAGTTNAVFTVRLSGPSKASVTIEYATEDDTASSPADYDGASGTVTFAPDDTLETVAVAVKGDALDEFAENFFLNLSNPQGPTATTGASATATIRDDDPTPSLSVNDVTVTEADSGTATARFAVSLSAASGKTVVADYSTADGTARVADGDYSEASGTLTFRPGVTERNVAVTINTDTKSEPAENLLLRLSGADNATLGDGEGEATIEDSVPTVLRAQPSEGATGVADAASVVAVFSKEMDPDSVNAQTFYLQREGSSEAIPAAVSYDATYRRAILDPTSRLAPGAGYTATMKGGAQGMKDASAKELAADKEWSFTVAPDQSAPSVRRVSPSEGARSISPRANVAATFSEAMSAASMNRSTFKLYKKGSTTTVGATVAYSPATNGAVLNPGANLKRGATYKVVVTSGATDLSGNALDQNPSVAGNQPKAWFFTVRN